MAGGYRSSARGRLLAVNGPLSCPLMHEPAPACTEANPPPRRMQGNKGERGTERVYGAALVGLVQLSLPVPTQTYPRYPRYPRHAPTITGARQPEASQSPARHQHFCNARPNPSSTFVDIHKSPSALNARKGLSFLPFPSFSWFA